MVFDEQGDEEPDEPEFAVRDGDDLIPEAPQPDEGPNTGHTSGGVDGNAPPEVEKTFWTVLLLVDAALVALIIGPVVAFFNGNVRIGGVIVFGGLFCVGLAYRRYRKFKRTPNEELGIAGDDESASSDPGRADHIDSE